ncbi:unnamed protein product [Cuscuta campestris]|uniref:Uncharacterized protein n=1 Tax=Cuscuta campestris TaxID=132261 RepID=A0A484MU47_9ASTE|nr:unnamed protein product [Cuscuta campestris]
MQQTAAEVIVTIGKSPRISGTPISETNPKLQFEVVHESPSFLAEISRLEMEFFTVKRNLETNSQDLSMPSFSLGLTPEEKENQNEEIQHEEGNLNTWKMDLNKNDVNGLRMLCVRYCYEMLTSDHNQLVVQVKRKVAEYGKFIN